MFPAVSVRLYQFVCISSFVSVRLHTPPSVICTSLSACIFIAPACSSFALLNNPIACKVPATPILILCHALLAVCLFVLAPKALPIASACKTACAACTAEHHCWVVDGRYGPAQPCRAGDQSEKRQLASQVPELMDVGELRILETGACCGWAPACTAAARAGGLLPPGGGSALRAASLYMRQFLHKLAVCLFTTRGERGTEGRLEGVGPRCR